jgi:riboflavin kinase/FMN adenylyltransferase
MSTHSERGSVVTIGEFDGVHLGHRRLIDRAKERARSLGVAAAVVTFDRHPASVVRPQSAPKLLTGLDHKLALLEDAGADVTLVLRFDADRAAEPAEDFVRDVLVGRLGARAVVVGYDFHFGKDRAGDADLLRAMGTELGFEVEEVPALRVQEDAVSSTRIRRVLAEGDVVTAAALMGRPHSVRGIVAMGDGRGRDLGFPTANVDVPAEIAIPGEGVYAGEYVFPDGSIKAAAISVGTRPTFYEDGANLVEAYVLDHDGPLYGQRAEVRFVSRVRGQERFDSIDALVHQMHADVDEVRAWWAVRASA